MRTRRSAHWVVLFAGTAFLGAGLLFVVQPLVAKLLLPTYGGSPTVWSTSSLFFQVLLLVSYLYVHSSTRRLGPRRQPWLHLLVLVLPLLALPLALPLDAAPPADSSPALWLLRTLVLVVGLPFAVVATTGPLLQKWFSWTGHRSAGDPYFLFAASNLGSFGGLLAYPLLIEPTMTLQQQRLWWSVGCVAFVVLSAACVVVAVRQSRGSQSAQARLGGQARSVGLPVQEPAAPPPAGQAAAVGWRRVAWWLGLAFLPSSLMLAVTAHLSTDVAAIPLLWVVPLAIYLATFVAAFSRRSRTAARWPARAATATAFVVTVITVTPGLAPIWATIALNLLLLALVGYAAHARLAADRPEPHHLTHYFLVVAIGGAAGGLLNGLLAPVVFDRVLEYPLGLVVVPLLMVGVAGDRSDWFSRRYHPVGLPVALTVGFAAVFAAVGVAENRGVIEQSRTFFGSYSVQSEGGMHKLVHGTTLHGTQWRDEPRRETPTAYYSTAGPLGDVFGGLDNGRFDRVAVVGLGSGTVAAYGRDGQVMTFFEIDAEIVRVASDPELFSYLADSPASIETVVGDGRLMLAEQPAHEFNLIILDAFSSDSIPIHLLTAEAMRMYADKLAPDGVLVVHISNRLFDLEPVLAAAAADLGWPAVIGNGTVSDATSTPSTWVALTPDQDKVDNLLRRPGWALVDRSEPVLWTDDYSSLFDVLL